MSFAEIDLGHDPILNKTKKAVIKFAWMSFPEIWLMSGNLPNYIQNRHFDSFLTQISYLI